MAPKTAFLQFKQARAHGPYQLPLQMETAPSELSEEVFKHLNTQLSANGKRIRPFLVALMGELFAIPKQAQETLALAVEFVHTASLIHDDVMDHSPSRRGVPSIHSQKGERLAILAGDLLLSQAVLALSQLGYTSLVVELNRTITDLVSGEWLQASFLGKIPTASDLAKINRLKTGSLMALSCSLPLRLFRECFPEKIDREVIDIATGMGHYLGSAFQLFDDIWDYHENNIRGTNDENLGQCNMVGLYLSQGKSLAAARREVLDQAKSQFMAAENHFHLILNGAVANQFTSQAKMIFSGLLEVLLSTFAADLMEPTPEATPDQIGTFEGY